MKIGIKYDRITDSVYLRFSDEKVASYKQLDRGRIVDYSADGEIRGITLLSVSFGVNTDDLPHKSAIERALAEKGFAKFTHERTAELSISEVPRKSTEPEEILWGLPVKDRTATLKWAAVAFMAFMGFAVVDVLLARNLFVLTSLPGQLASTLGLIVTLFPTVLGCLIMLAWILYARGQASSLKS